MIRGARRRVATGAVLGVLWAGVAIGVYAAMVRGYIPAAGEVALPIAIVIVVAYLPFLLGLGLETLVGRSSDSFAEVILVVVACGLTLGAAFGWLSARPWRRRR